VISETHVGWVAECEFGVGVFSRSFTSEGRDLDVALSNQGRDGVLGWVAGSAGMPPGKEIVSMEQVHGSAVVTVEDPDTMDSPRPVCDALISTDSSQALAGVTADCVPLILFCDFGCAVIHAGWRGLAAGVIRSAVFELGLVTGLDASAMVAFVGPAAGACCYEVGDEVLQEIGKTAIHNGNLLSSGDTAIVQLRQLGIENVQSVDVCTICSDPSLLNSYRRDGDKAGRQGVIAWLN